LRGGLLRGSVVLKGEQEVSVAVGVIERALKKGIAEVRRAHCDVSP
jgi:hypothetical protein